MATASTTRTGRSRGRALVYGRVSRRTDPRQASLESQVEGCLALAQDEGYTVRPDDIFTERYSGHDTADDRLNLAEIRRRVATGDYKAIIFYHTDRLARSAEEVLLLVKEFRSAGCRTHFVKCAYDDTTREGRLLLFVLGWASENEWEMIQERTQRGLRKIKEAGKWVGAGQPRFGYSWNKETRERRAIPEQAAIVRRIFTMAADEGLSIIEISRRLNAEGVPTPSTFRTKGRHAGKVFRWRPCVVAAILHDKTYMGMVVGDQSVKTGEKRGGYNVRRKLRPHEIEATPDPLTDRIIEPEMWYRSLDNIARRGNNGAANSRNVCRPFLFRGRIFCGNCGHRMVPAAEKRHPKRNKYRCNAYYLDKEAGDSLRRCKPFTVCQHVLEPLAWKLVEEAVLTPGFIEAQCERVLKDDSDLPIRRELNIALEAVQDARRRLRNLTDALASAANDTVRAALSESLNMAGLEIDRLTERAERLTARLRPYEDREKTVARIHELAEAVRAQVSDPSALSFEEKRDILERFGVTIIVNFDRTIVVRMETDIPEFATLHGAMLRMGDSAEDEGESSSFTLTAETSARRPSSCLVDSRRSTDRRRSSRWPSTWITSTSRGWTRSPTRATVVASGSTA